MLFLDCEGELVDFGELLGVGVSMLLFFEIYNFKFLEVIFISLLLGEDSIVVKEVLIELRVCFIFFLV